MRIVKPIRIFKLSFFTIRSVLHQARNRNSEKRKHPQSLKGKPFRISLKSRCSCKIFFWQSGSFFNRFISGISAGSTEKIVLSIPRNYVGVTNVLWLWHLCLYHLNILPPEQKNFLKQKVRSNKKSLIARDASWWCHNNRYISSSSIT